MLLLFGIEIIILPGKRRGAKFMKRINNRFDLPQAREATKSSFFSDRTTKREGGVKVG